MRACFGPDGLQFAGAGVHLLLQGGQVAAQLLNPCAHLGAGWLPWGQGKPVRSAGAKAWCAIAATSGLIACNRWPDDFISQSATTERQKSTQKAVPCYRTNPRSSGHSSF